MKLSKLAREIYLGDQGIISFSLNFFDQTAEVELTSAKRLTDDLWSSELGDIIDNAVLKFDGVSAFSIDPIGAMPSDFIGQFWAEPRSDGGERFCLEVDARLPGGALDLAVITIEAEGVVVLSRAL